MSATRARPAAVATGGARLAASERSDVLHIRVDQPSETAGLSLCQGGAVLTGALRLMQAAAQAALRPAARFQGRRPGAVKTFVERDVRVGRADADDPTIAIITRLDADDVVETRSLATGAVRLAPFQRRVNATLASTLLETVDVLRLHRAVDRDARVSIGGPAVGLHAMIARGLSADVCDALLGMIRAPNVAMLSFSFYWAPRPELGSPTVVRAAIRRDDLAGLYLLRERLRTLPEHLQTAVYGQVTRLDRGERTEGGVATIHGVVGRSTPRTVQVTLTGAEYDDAIRAYRTRLPVLATGRLRRSGAVHILTGRFAVAASRAGSGP